MSPIEKFMPLVLEKEEEGTQTPICVHQDVTFVYIKYNNLYRILSILIIVPYRYMHVCEFIHGQNYNKTERVSIECRKTKTKVITLANQKGWRPIQ